jgi:2-polyprenyl-3-methyl-5-hydroxy-6-metoxy-1,4-benzoquinol methylase
MAAPTMNRPTPERIFATLTAFQKAAALKTAIEVDIFTAIVEGANDPAAIAKRCGVSERGARILCDYLVVQELLLKHDGKYNVTPDTGFFLNRRSLAYMGGVVEFLTNRPQRQSFDDLTESVRRGGSPAENSNMTQEQDEIWIAFAKSMAPLTEISAKFIAQLLDASSEKPMKVLDIAASHGLFGITIAKANPNAQIVALDWPNVLQVALENAKNAGVADRLRGIPGSAFDAEFGAGYDAVLVTNLYHHFDAPTCERLARKIHAALKPGGKMVTLEFVPNEDRVSPPMAAGFALVMLAATDKGDAYTFSEYEKMFRNASFAKTTMHLVPDMPQTVLVSER